MTPKQFLLDECSNARRLLESTLRHDYAPEQGKGYFEECNLRLKTLEMLASSTADDDRARIAGLLNELTKVVKNVSIFERSRLGEFSWPFSSELRRLATSLLEEPNIRGGVQRPLIQIVSEGQGYRILQEPLQAASQFRFLFVFFPPSLKHHVLLHAIFGHEIAHAAIFATHPGARIQMEVLPKIEALLPLSSVAAMNSWLQDQNSPPEVKMLLSNHQRAYGTPLQFSERDRQSWKIELFCDLFGLVLFGPAFFAALHVYLKPKAGHDFNVSSTHPPYGVRWRLLASAMVALGWDSCITSSSDNDVNQAESAALNFLMSHNVDNWCVFASPSELAIITGNISKTLSNFSNLSYMRPDAETLCLAVNKLVMRSPPLVSSINDQGEPQLRVLPISQMLYAGWVCWLGKDHLPNSKELSFSNVNRLCDHALLQQEAIALAMEAGAP